MNLNYQLFYKELEQNPISFDEILEDEDLKEVKDLKEEAAQNDSNLKRKLDESLYNETVEMTEDKSSEESECEVKEKLIKIDEIMCTDSLDSDSDSTFSDLTLSDSSDKSDLEDEDQSEEENKSNQDSMEVDEFFDSEYLIDSKNQGNISRFFNHSCNPNLICQLVFTKLQHPTFTECAFFAYKDIKAFSELTFDYFLGNEQQKKFKCKCNSKRCIDKVEKKT